MLRIERKTLIALAMATIAGIVPATAQSGKQMSAERLTSGEWLAEDIGGRGVIDNARSTVTIAPDGAVSGSGACNRLRGRATVNGSAVAFSPLATTRMACAPAVMDQEQKFLAALEATRGYRVDGDVLVFLDVGGATLIRFTQAR